MRVPPRRGVLPTVSERRLPSRLDAALATALFVPALVQVLAVPIAARPVGVVIAAFSTLPVAWRRIAPVPAALVGSLPWVVPAHGFVYLGYVAAFILYYSAAAHEESDRTLAAGLVVGIVLSVVGTILNAEAWQEIFGALSTVLAPALAGRVVRRERRRQAELEALTRHLEAERDLRERAAVAEERGRIARELHDVVAHALSVIAIQADAAEAALDRDPDRSRRPLDAIRSESRRALAEMRRLLGVLRTPEGEPENAPQPGLGELSALVARARAAGLPVELRESGPRHPLPASLDLSAYRIVQEALTNVARHAPGARTTVALDWGDGALGITVRDLGAGAGASVNGNGHGGGHGLVGMRERARIHGGTVEAQPVAGGGFEVRASLPLADA